MDSIQIGRSPVHASRVVFGTMAIGNARHDANRRVETIRAAIDAGITSLDTAPLYDFGSCERTVARAIDGIRDRVQVFTKVGLRWDDPHGEVMFTTRDEHGREIAVRKNSRPESVRLEVERSLARLGVDVLDMVFVHQLDRDTPIAETMGALRDLLREGKLRAIGVSTNYSARHVLEAQRALGDVPVAGVQIHYSPLSRQQESEVIPVARENRIGVLAHSPLERGLLTGKIVPSTTFPADDVRRGNPRFHADNIKLVTEGLRHLEHLAAAHGVTVGQLMLAWVLAQPTVSAIVVGASGPDQVRANARAGELRLGADELLAIARVFDDLRLDPYAGLGFATRLALQGRRLASGARRRLAGVLGKAGLLPRVRRRET
jgi:aryl-alcohol dehydrogenase-like predicted oxidoreductase